ncbi:MAG: alpha-amylase family glycosyl hydrolase, partial [Bacteroidota bacterium]
MRKIFTLFITFWIVGNISAQVVTVSPSFPKVTDEITLTFDVTQSSDGRSEGLLGLTDDVFLWSGAGDDTDAFIFGPEGQTDFNVPFTPGTMTSLGDDLWSITLTPKDYYSIPDEANVTRLGLLLKNGDGSAQTEDVFIEIFEEGGLNISILSPQTGTFYDVDEMVRVEAEASEVSDFSFTVNGISQGAPINGTSAFIDIMVNEPQLDIVVTADNGQTTAKDSIRLLQRPMSPTAELPANVMDGINYIDNNTIIFVLAAPDKNFAYLTGEFSDWQLTNDLLMNKTPDGQRFWVQLDGLTPNVEYAFQYWVYDNDENLVRTGDPYAEIILDPNNDRFISDDIYPNLKLYPDGAQEIVSLFETGQEDYVFQTTDFERPAPEDLVVYELLIRDFDEAGSFQSVIDRIDYIADLGVNAIELMPIMEFSGNISWGYNTIYHTAVDKSYGTRDKLKELIDVAHSRGMAVILDIVFNHADFASPLVKMYFDPDAGQFGRPSVNNPWCNPVATHPFSVFADFNHDSELLRQFIDRVNRYWIEEFKVDGFRYDLSKGFTQNFTTDVGAWNALDNSRVSNLVRMLEEVRTYDE